MLANFVWAFVVVFDAFCRAWDTYDREGLLGLLGVVQAGRHSGHGRASRAMYRYRGWGEGHHGGPWSASLIVANLREARTREGLVAA